MCCFYLTEESFNFAVRLNTENAWNVGDMQMFGSVSSILRVDADDAVREQDCNTVRIITSSCFGR